MVFKLPNGKVVTPGRPFEHDGWQYPADWIARASPAQKGALGLLEQPDPRPADSRFYFVSADGDPVPRPLDQIRAGLVADIKAKAHSLIAQVAPEWKQLNLLTRGIEMSFKLHGKTPLDQNETKETTDAQVVWDKIKAVRQHSDALEAEVYAATFEMLLTWQQHDWPEAVL